MSMDSDERPQNTIPASEPIPADKSGSTYGLAPVLTVKEVADFLRLNLKTVHAAIAQGQMPGKKVRGRTLVLRDELLRWLAEGQGTDE